MEFSELLKRRRSIRRYRPEAVGTDPLQSLVEAARHAPSAANNQLLRYTLIAGAALAEKVFRCTAWGARVKPHRSPRWGVDAPTAFIAVSAAAPEGKHLFADAGAAIMLMELRAAELALGTCWIGAFDPGKVAELIELPAGESLLYLLAVGHPAEAPVEESIEAGENAGYYLDAQDVIHVPKFSVKALTRIR